MSLLLSVALATAGVAVGRLVLRAVTKRPAPLPEHVPPPASPPATSPGPTKAKPKVVIAPESSAERLPFACQLGDVIVRSSGEEAWLAGCVVFEEVSPALCLFFAPEAGQDISILARPEPSRDLVWLLPVSGAMLFPGTDPPSALEYQGVRYERERRLPLSARRLGAGAPDLGAQAVVADYRSAGFERLLVVVASGVVRTYVGQLLEPGMYDHLPGDRNRT
jgi:hypothetical protein